MPTKDNSYYDILKSLLVIFIPLITAITVATYQYSHTLKIKSDDNYRVIVGQLTDADKDKRHAAAAMLGTYIKIGDPYYTETIDLLMNRLLIETSHDVSSSILGSLIKIKNEPEYGQIIERLLAQDRSNFVLTYPSKVRLDKYENTYSSNLKKLMDLQDNTTSDSQLAIDEINQRVKASRDRFLSLQKHNEDIQISTELLPQLISIFLSEKQGQKMTGLEFFRNNLSNVVLTGLILQDTRIKWSSFSSSTLTDSKFENSKIERTYFSNSNLKNTVFAHSKISNTIISDALLENSDFSNCILKDVYFIGSDMRGTNFSGVKGLHPEYFYGTKNLDKASFDDPSILVRAKAITEIKFREFVASSRMDNDKKHFLVPGINTD